MTVVNDQLTSKTATGDQPEIQEQLDYAPRMVSVKLPAMNPDSGSQVDLGLV